MYYDTAIEIIKDYPLAGVGFDNYRVIYPMYRPTKNPLGDNYLPSRVHNTYLELALTGGIPSLLLYLLLISLILYDAINKIRSAMDTHSRIVCISLLGAVCGYLVQDFTGWEEIALAPFYWIVLGLLVSCSCQSENTTTTNFRLNYLGFTVIPIWLGIVVYLVPDVYNRVYAERVLWEVRAGKYLENSSPELDRIIDNAVSLVSSEHQYLMQAGLLYSKQYERNSNVQAYIKSKDYFNRSFLKNPFDEYSLINALKLDLIALNKRLIEKPSDVIFQAEIYAASLNTPNPTLLKAIQNVKLAASQLDDMDH